jgi:DNA repair photolyase
VCILTKSGLVTRDIDVVARMPDASVGFSVAFHDEGIREIFEAKAPPNDQKIAALKTLKDAGIETYVLICPVMPFITNINACIEMVAPYADTIWFYALSMASEEDQNWQYILKILERHYPELINQFQQPAFSSDHPYWNEVRAKIEAIKLESGLNMKIEL